MAQGAGQGLAKATDKVASKLGQQLERGGARGAVARHWTRWHRHRTVGQQAERQAAAMCPSQPGRAQPQSPSHCDFNPFTEF